jgi:hypothetical protein
MKTKVLKTPLILSVLFLAGSLTAVADDSQIALYNNNIAETDDIKIHLAGGHVDKDINIPAMGKRETKLFPIHANLASVTTWELTQGKTKTACTLPAQPAGVADKATVTVSQTTAIVPTYTCAVSWNTN